MAGWRVNDPPAVVIGLVLGIVVVAISWVVSAVYDWRERRR